MAVRCGAAVGPGRSRRPRSLQHPGVLRERAADAVHALLGEPSPSVRKSFLREAVWQCAAAGLTCVHTHEFGEGWSAAEAWDVYAQLQAR